MDGTGSALYSDLQGYGYGQKVISGSFIYDGSKITSVTGKGFTAARSSAGTYTVTLSVNYKSLLAGIAHLCPGTAPSKFQAQVQAGLTSNNVVTIITSDGSSNAPTAADAGTTDAISFVLVLSTSSLDA